MKYTIRFCSCGRIHYFNNKLLDWMEEDIKNRAIIQTCTNCGKTYKIWFSEHYDEDNGNGVDFNSIELTTCVLPENNHNSYKSVLSKGIPVSLKKGRADDFINGIFLNQKGWDNASRKNCQSLWTYAERKEPWCTVDMDKTIKNVCDEVDFNNKMLGEKDNPSDVLKDISSYSVKGLNWENTPYATKYNCF